MAKPGWNKLYDEGIRLLATTNGWTGIKTRLVTPIDYACDVPQAYFNYYLGINESAGRKSGGIKIEAGISYSADAQGKSRGWSAFINHHGTEIASKSVNIAAGATVNLELKLEKGKVFLMIDADAVSGATTLKHGAPKMVVALQESHGNIKDRKVWFDKAGFSCLGVYKSGKLLSTAQSGVRFYSDVIDRKLFHSVVTANSLSVTMKKP